MANRRKLFIDWTTKTLIKGLRDQSIYILPTFHKYETVPLEVSIVEPGTSPTAAWSKLDVDNIALTVSMNDTLDDATPFAMLDTWTKDSEQNTLSGDLILNTVAANAFIGSTASVSAYFEVQMVESSARVKLYRATVTFAQGILQPTSTSPNPSDEYYTKGQTDSLFIKPIMTAGQTITLTSSDGAWQRIIGVNDDGVPIDDIVAVT